MTAFYLHKATGIGSLPHRSAREAMALIHNNLKSVPHWPQLPQMSPEENIIRQCLSPLINANLISVTPAGTPFFVNSDPQWESRVLSFFELLLEDEENPEKETDTFAFPPESAGGFYRFLQDEQTKEGDGPVKGQVAGPVTLGFQVTDSRGNPAFYSDQLREILAKTLSRQAIWQLRRLRDQGKEVIIFLDEPMLYAYGSSSYVGLGKEPIRQSLQEIIGALKQEKAIVGVHCCSGPDWSILLELPLDLISFDAYSYLISLVIYSGSLSSFLQGGGALAWGIIPASPDVLHEDVSSLWEKLQRGMESLAGQGVDLNLLKKQMMVTPSCGTGSRTPDLAERVYSLAGQLETRLGRQTL